MNGSSGLNGHNPDWGIETLLGVLPILDHNRLNGHNPDWGIETAGGPTSHGRPRKA